MELSFHESDDMVGKSSRKSVSPKPTSAVPDEWGQDLNLRPSGYEPTRRPSSTDLTGDSAGYAFLRAQANTIEGGTTEIPKNILGEQALGLPGEPRVDKDVPWIEVPRW
jgi:hypothetical protein